MKVIKSPDEFRRCRTQLASDSIGFVPTMGGLHSGHLELVKKSLSKSDMTVVSVFLNPTQFNSEEDLKTYPADLSEDLDLLESLNVDYVFAPEFQDIYPDSYRYSLHESEVSEDLCGAHRPGHFDGVLTVVMKLFQIVRPTRAYFGEKDFQQLELIKGMVHAFFLDVEICSVPTVRESSGLAMSSRNRKLSLESQEKASTLFKALSTSDSIEQAREQIEKQGFDVDYLVEKWNRRFVAASIDGVRLIDNVEIPLRTMELR